VHATPRPPRERNSRVLTRPGRAAGAKAAADAIAAAQDSERSMDAVCTKMTLKLVTRRIFFCNGTNFVFAMERIFFRSIAMDRKAAGKVLVLKVAGFGVPALDVLHEALPVLRVCRAGAEGGAETLGGTDEVLHMSASPQHHEDDVQSAGARAGQQRHIASSFQRSATCRPDPIDTSQFAYTSPTERGDGEQGNERSPVSPMVLPLRRNSRVSRTSSKSPSSRIARTTSPNSSKPRVARTSSNSPRRASHHQGVRSSLHSFGTMDLIWHEIFLAGLDEEMLTSRAALQLVVECRHPRDSSLLWSTAPVSLDTVLCNRGLARHEVLLTPHRAGIYNTSWVLEEGSKDGEGGCASQVHSSSEMRVAGAKAQSAKAQLETLMVEGGFRGTGGRLEIEARALSAHNAARRAAAFKLARETKLFGKHLDEQDAAGDTPLIRACRDRKLVHARILLVAGAQVEITNHGVRQSLFTRQKPPHTGDDEQHEQPPCCL